AHAAVQVIEEPAGNASSGGLAQDRAVQLAEAPLVSRLGKEPFEAGAIVERAKGECRAMLLEPLQNRRRVDRLGDEAARWARGRHAGDTNVGKRRERCAERE